MVEITKQDWKNAKTQFESLLVNAMINSENYKVCLEKIEEKLKEFPADEEEEMKEDIKKVLDE